MAEHLDRASRTSANLVRANAGSALLEAAMMLLIGGYLHYIGLTGVSDSQLYNLSIPVLVWVLLLGGTLMLAVSGLCFLGWRYALAADTVVSGLSGILILLCGGVWLMNSDLFQGGILLIFGVMSVNSARNSWHRHTLITRPDSSFDQTPDWQPHIGPDTEELRPADPRAKERALERLLSTKQEAAPQEKPTTPTSAEHTEPPPARPASHRKEPAPPPTDEAPPEGFLAQLGTDPDDEGA